ncbi:hypothetical protein J2Z69_000113 [Paenibacillus shirakamiensis]|uniref:Uncharacterized protein n=1 Tax=Paenibacillus shirakamiensis TaxID=1265935 RepID=A0ABS4JET1_9BACL|nr:hypothetical protein [Paenibacillus shirakamiensis]MBP1999094.1 hypothetical protein [Paenibacillus shirakamiensis]
MRLVTTMMTETEMSDSDISKATDILRSQFNKKYEIQSFYYDDSKYREFDNDLFDVDFSSERIYDDIDKLIFAYEEILKTVSHEIDFIAGNDDTHFAVVSYEQNNENIENFGSFVTRRIIPKLQPYYSSQICNAYVNLTHVSFGVYL